ncbi:TIGR03089 family protein [Melissospora conviva]|uniref:TIGR03089 family protein n=1 Tax=Melissospora conviva TaxID=3388432 RepID=UPI003B7B2BA2
MADNISRIFAAAVAIDPARPLLTWYDDATGERTELSGATLANWVAKTANLMVDEVGAGPGGRAAVLLPPHWQTAAVLLGCWSAGVEVTAAPGEVDALFATVERAAEAAAWSAGEQYALALHPLAAPLREVPAGFTDYVVQVRGQGDHFTPYPFGETLVAEAIDRAGELAIAAGERVLIDVGRNPDPLDWLLAPLATGSSVVLCANLDRDKLTDRIAVERVTVPLA